MFLDDFFRVNAEVELPARKGKAKEKLIVRTLSDSEIQERAEYALSEQARMSNALRDVNSDMYHAKISILVDATTEALIDTIAEVRRVDASREAQEMYAIDFYPYPDDASMEEKLETLERQKKHEESIYTARAQYIVNQEGSLRKRLVELPREVILDNAKVSVSKIYLIKAATEAELWFTIAHAYETLDGKQRWSMDEVKKLSGRIVDRLAAEYRKVDAIDPWELTKSVPEGSSSGVVSSDTDGERQSGE